MLVFPLIMMQPHAWITLLGAVCHGSGESMAKPSLGRVIGSVSVAGDERTNSGIYQTYYRAAAGIDGLLYAVMNIPASALSESMEHTV